MQRQVMTQGGRHRFRQGAIVQRVTSHGSTWLMDAATCVRMRGRTATAKGRKLGRFIRTHEGMLERSNDVVAAILGGA